MSFFDKVMDDCKRATKSQDVFRATGSRKASDAYLGLSSDSFGGRSSVAEGLSSGYVVTDDNPFKLPY